MEIEDPFGYDSNDLPLLDYGAKMSDELDFMLQCQQYPFMEISSSFQTSAKNINSSSVSSSDMVGATEAGREVKEATKAKRNNNRSTWAAQGWDKKKVAEWLRGVGMDALAELFSKHSIDGPTLLELDCADLRHIGVPQVGKQKRLLHLVAQLGAQTSL